VGDFWKSRPAAAAIRIKDSIGNQGWGSGRGSGAATVESVSGRNQR
jgi:hypothetical protein